MRFFEILVEDYKTALKQFVDQGNNEEEVKQVLQQFKNIQSKIKKENEKNIDWWAKNKSFEMLKNFIKDVEEMPTLSQFKKIKKSSNSITLHEDDKWLFVIPLDKDASCFYGKNTDWCVSKKTQNHFEEYFYDNEIILIYLISKESGGKWAIAFNTINDNMGLYDSKDTSLSAEVFELETGFNPREIVNSLPDNVLQQAKSSINEYRSLIGKIENELEKVKKGEHNKKLEKLLIETSDIILIKKYFYNVGKSDNYNEVLQYIAVSMDGNIIKFIEEPSENIKVEALKSNTNAIKYIDDLTPKMQYILVSKTPLLFTHEKITNKENEKIQKAAVGFGMHSDENLKYILDNDILSSDDVIIHAINSNNRYNKHNLQKLVIVLINYGLSDKFENEIKTAFNKDTSQEIY